MNLLRIARVCILFGPSALLSLQMNAQNPDIQLAKTAFKATQVIPPSPDAAALGRYGNVPVSLFTGTPSISIPLTELKGNFLSLPVSLSYNASGFKPEEVAPWTGLGWTLQAGGVITRAVKGNPDLSGNYFTTPSPFIEPTGSYDKVTYMNDIRDGTKETQPDIYYYNFMGHSGRFYLKNDGQVFKKDKDMLRIQYLGDVFTITDETGTVYSFSTRESTETVPTDQEDEPSYLVYNYTSAWYLTTATSANESEVLQFAYDNNANRQPLYVNAMQRQSGLYRCPSPAQGLGAAASSVNSYPPYTQTVRRFPVSATLKRSNITVGFIEFGAGIDQRQDLWTEDFAGERRLEALRLYSVVNAANTLVSDHRFAYSYFPTRTGNAGELRMRLDQVTEMAVNGVTTNKPPYIFEYSSTAVPSRYTAAIDHWGFYNAANGNTSLVPNVQSYIDGTLRTYGNGANREPSFSGSAATIIKKITYPTGGYTTFEFEGHPGAGGVRIKKIDDFSFGGQKASSKSYTYGMASMGEVPRYDNTSTYTTYFPATTMNSLSISSRSIYGLGSVQGSHVGYEQVTEMQVDGLGRPLGKTVNTFKVGFFLEHQNDISSGDLIKQEIYDSEDKLVLEKTNVYTYSQEPGALVDRVIQPSPNQNDLRYLCQENTGDPAGSYYLDASGHVCIRSTVVPVKYQLYDYTIATQQKRMTSQTVRKLDQATNVFLTTSSYYEYAANHPYPILVRQTASNTNEEVATSTKYVGDFIFGAPADPVAISLNAVSLKNILGAEVEKVQYRQNSDGSNKRYINGMVTTYTPAGLPEKLYRLEMKAPLTSFTASSITGGLFAKMADYQLLSSSVYNATGNLIEQTKSDDITTSYLWDYSNGYPVAAVTNASTSQVAYTSFETDYSGEWSITGTTFNASYMLTGKRSCNLGSGTAITKSFSPATTRMLMVGYWTRGAAVTVLANGSNAAATPQGTSINGWYYYEHKIPVGTTSISISAAGAIIDELRLFPDQSAMTTNAYTPFTGVITQNDAFNKVTYYEYDGLQRLANIKDQSGNIIKNFLYNYGNGAPVAMPATLFYSPSRTMSFTRTGCAAGSSGTAVTYSIAYGKYVSAISQADADAKADTDITTLGPIYGNDKSLCMFPNSPKSAQYTKNDCPASKGTGLPYTYTVHAGTFRAATSQEANALAQYAADHNGQPTANANGHCSCEAIGYKVVNAPTCEQGARVNTGWVQDGAQYKCFYKYQFSDQSFSETYFEYKSTAGACNLQSN